MEKPELEWRYRSTNDSEYATAKYKGFEIAIQDCDGDFSRWHVKRGQEYIAMGELESSGDGDGYVYHMDGAMRLAEQVFGYIWKAVDMNDFVHNRLPKIEEHERRCNCGQLPEYCERQVSQDVI